MLEVNLYHELKLLFNDVRDASSLTTHTIALQPQSHTLHSGGNMGCECNGLEKLVCPIEANLIWPARVEEI